MPLRRPEPGSFEHLLVLAPVALAGLWRMSRWPATEPYFSRSARFRFDDPAGRAGAASAPAGGQDAAGAAQDEVAGGTSRAVFGVLYAGDSVETAFCESILHGEHWFRQGRFEVPAGELRGRCLVGLRHPRRQSLNMVDLTERRLKALGLSMDVSAGDDYTRSQQWARAVHDALPQADGIRYHSRQRPGALCHAVFDRSGVQRGDVARLTARDLRLLCGALNVVGV